MSSATAKAPDINVLWNNQREAELKIDSLAIRVDEIQEAFMPRKISVPPLVLTSSGSGAARTYQLDTIAALWISTLGISPNRIESISTPSPPATPFTTRLLEPEETSSLHSYFFVHGPSDAIGSRRKAVITHQLIQFMPSSLSRESLLSSLKSTLYLHPVCFFHYEIEQRIRILDHDSHSFATQITNIPVSLFAVAAASMTLGSLAYQVERKTWKMPSEIPDNERDITTLFDMARLAISLSGESMEECFDAILASLILVVFLLHAYELDGYKTVVSGIASVGFQRQLGQLLDTIRRKSEYCGLLREPPNKDQSSSLWQREQRRMLAAAVAFYDFHVSDLIGNKITLDAASYTTETPTPLEDRTFKPSCTAVPPPASASINHSTLFAAHRARLLKTLLQARVEVMHVRDREREQMLAAAESASQNGDDQGISKHPALPRSAGDTLEQWDSRLHQQQENLPHSIAFDSSSEYATEVNTVFSTEQRSQVPLTESNVTLGMGYSIAQQAELAALVAYHQMKLAALLLENAVIHKPRGSPPSANGTVAAVRTLDAAQSLLHVIQVQRHVLKKKMPLSLSNFVYGKRIFDAGVIFGVLCTIPSSRRFEQRAVMAAAQGLIQSIELLKDLESWLRTKEEIQDASTSTETTSPLRILEALSDRAGIQMNDGVVESVTPKRKRTAFDLEEDQAVYDGLILPYVVGGVWVVGKPSTLDAWTISKPEPSPRAPAVSLPAPVSLPVPVSPTDVQQDEHREKRVRLDGIVTHPPAPLALTDIGVARPEASSALKVPDAGTSNGARPVSATTGSKPTFGVRSRVKELLRRPKRKPSMPNVQPKTESPMDSADDDYTDRFAFSLPDKSADYQQYPAQGAGQPQNNLGLSLSQADDMSMDGRSVIQGSTTNNPVEQLTPVEVSMTSDARSQASYAPGYPSKAWGEMDDASSYSGQPSKSTGYHPSNLMISQPENASSYHHQPPAPQPQSSQHHPYQMAQTTHGQSYIPQHPQLAMHHDYQSQSRHQTAVPMHGMMQYPQGYSGYSGSVVDNGARHPPQLITDGTRSQHGSQPSSAVTMGDPSMMYSGVSMQSLTPSTMYPPPPQDGYPPAWNPSEHYYNRY
ncbi:SubName: Full=Uncharacterized protein {ECO:0000313/EMBL:CCA67341.1} [Serendipita indica DSM 11827]|nr:SubName: Full=Uncharacterized protein {ECO:0000313/EMBL:CCA67341.1} [Serendipita indica DSM 11827]